MPNMPPPYHIPLSPDELARLGVVTVMWGQIDEAFNTILRWVLKLDAKVFNSLLGRQMIGSRVDHLNAAIPTVNDEQTRELMASAVKKMRAILPRRNAAMHGCWGLFVLDPTFRSFRVGTYNHQKPNHRFYTEDIAELHDGMVEVLSVLGAIAMRSLEPAAAPVNLEGNRIYYAPQPPDARAAGVMFRRGDRVLRVEPPIQDQTE
ncbi:MAG: hypothetical protein ABTQ31_04550 [Rhizobiaceae bacterium]